MVLGLTAVVFLNAQLWQTAAVFSASSVAEDMRYVSIQMKVGVIATALNWGACVLLIGASIRWYLMHAEMKILAGITQEKPKEDEVLQYYLYIKIKISAF